MGVAGNYQNPEDIKGLCLPDNADQPYVATGLCQSLYEQMTSGCTKDLIEKIRQRYLSDKDDTKPMYLGLSCGNAGGNGKQERTLRDIAKDPRQFTFVLFQFFAAVAVKTSNWNVLDDIPDNSPQPKDKKQGVYHLSLNDMMKDDYKCGCQEKVKTCKAGGGDSEGELTVPGECPGPPDGHHSLTCGVHMALYHAEKDGVLFGGKDKKKGGNGKSSGEDDDGPRGASRIFKVLEDDNEDKAARKDPKNPDDRPTTRGFVQKKLQNWCKNEGPSQVNKWSSTLQDITLDQGAGGKTTK